MTILAAPSDLDQTLTALADPTRRAILHRLSNGDARVTDLAQPFAISLNAVSKHIRVLERARLVQRRRSGRDHYLSINPKPLDEASAWLEAQRARWTARLDALDDVLKAEDAPSREERRNDRRTIPDLSHESAARWKREPDRSSRQSLNRQGRQEYRTSDHRWEWLLRVSWRPWRPWRFNSEILQRNFPVCDWPDTLVGMADRRDLKAAIVRSTLPRSGLLPRMSAGERSAGEAGSPSVHAWRWGSRDVRSHCRFPHPIGVRCRWRSPHWKPPSRRWSSSRARSTGSGNRSSTPSPRSATSPISR